MAWYRFFLFFWCLLYPLAGEAAKSTKVRFSKEELAKESVLPVFDPMHLVLGRNVTLSKRLEGGVSVSFGLDEPFYFPAYVTGLLAFYISEAHGMSVTGTWFPPLKETFLGFSWDGVQLKNPKQPEVEPIDVWKVPYPQMTGFLNYQYTPFYGKISVAKKIVTNLSIYGFAGPGIIMFNESTIKPAGNMGVGLKIYFNRWLALRGSLRFYGYYGPAPAKIPLKSQTSDLSYGNIPSSQKGLIINLLCSLGFVFLI